MPVPKHTTIATYSDWFRQFAINHKLVKHELAAESPDGPSGKQSFHMFQTSDVLVAQRRGMNPDVTNILVAPYELKPTDENRNADYRGIYTGAFTCVRRAQPDSFTDELRAREETEIVMWDLIHKMIESSQESPDGMHCDAPFGVMYDDSFQVMPVGPIWEWHYGWYVTFNFKIPTKFWRDKVRVDGNMV